MEILARVPALDLPKLRYVCKAWNNILKDPLFHQLHDTFHVQASAHDENILKVVPGGRCPENEPSDRFKIWVMNPVTRSH